MGLSAAAETGVGRRPDPVLRVISTPRLEAELTCRFVLDVLELVRASGGMRGQGSDGLPRERVDPASADLTILDPACGEGHMLLGMAGVLRASDERSFHTERKCARRVLHGVDVQSEVVERAKSAFQGTQGETFSEVHCVCGDALHLTDQCIWDRIAPSGGYDCVVGNPPYVRHEAIRDPLGREESRAYKESIACGLRARFPGLRLDGRADLALLFTLLGVSLLEPLGVLGFVLPSSLFDARYGRVLEEALDIWGRRGLFLESETRRSFSEASVNTGIFLAGPECSQGLIPRLRRCRVAGTLERLPIREMWENRDSRPSRTSPRPAVSNRRMEVPPVPIVPLSTLGSVRYPVKTGLNSFFYVGADVINQFEIENEFLTPALKSPRDVSTIRFDAGDAACRLFVCRFSEEELRARGNDGAYAYVQWGSQQHTASGIAWPEVASLRGRTPWYRLSVPPSAHIVCPRFFDRRYLFVVPVRSVVEDQTFYGLILHEPAQRDLISALLNSSFVHLSLEQHGRSGLGDGVRQFALCDMAALPVPDPRVIQPACEAAILDAYRHVSRRPLLPVPQEYEIPDRLALDEAVGRAFGLTRVHMQHVRGTVMERMERRLQRARSMER